MNHLICEKDCKCKNKEFKSDKEEKSLNHIKVFWGSYLAKQESKDNKAVLPKYKTNSNK